MNKKELQAGNYDGSAVYAAGYATGNAEGQWQGAKAPIAEPPPVLDQGSIQGPALPEGPLSAWQAGYAAGFAAGWTRGNYEVRAS